MFKRIGPERHIEQRWRNGEGSTVEIAREPAAGDFIWRLSMAAVQQAGAFSVFPHVDRTLLLLDGAGLELDFGPHGRVRVDRPHVPIRFASDWPTDCTLLAGPVRDLNLMVDRRFARADVRVLTADDSQPAAAITLLYALLGDWRASVAGGASERLSAGELLVVREQAGRTLALAGAGRVVRADLAPSEEN
jgi:uncharacterized protein